MFSLPEGIDFRSREARSKEVLSYTDGTAVGVSTSGARVEVDLIEATVESFLRVGLHVILQFIARHLKARCRTALNPYGLDETRSVRAPTLLSLHLVLLAVCKPGLCEQIPSRWRRSPCVRARRKPKNPWPMHRLRIISATETTRSWLDRGDPHVWLCSPDMCTQPMISYSYKINHSSLSCGYYHSSHSV